jgi:hypothetical protein
MVRAAMQARVWTTPMIVAIQARKMRSRQIINDFINIKL